MYVTEPQSMKGKHKTKDKFYFKSEKYQQALPTNTLDKQSCKQHQSN